MSGVVSWEEDRTGFPLSSTTRGKDEEGKKGRTILRPRGRRGPVVIILCTPITAEYLSFLSVPGSQSRRRWELPRSPTVHEDVGPWSVGRRRVDEQDGRRQRGVWCVDSQMCRVRRLRLHGPGSSICLRVLSVFPIVLSLWGSVLIFEDSDKCTRNTLDKVINTSVNIKGTGVTVDRETS